MITEIIAIRLQRGFLVSRRSEEMRRLNVREAQIDMCIRESMFALSDRPRNPELQPGELLLLQLVKEDALRLRKIAHRIEFALVFDRLEPDHDGTISRAYWPNEGREWKWIIYGSATIPTIPFSLEGLGLSKDYTSQNTSRSIDASDERRIEPYIQWSLAQSPKPQMILPLHIAQKFGSDLALTTIFNHDRIAIRRQVPPINVSEKRYHRNSWLADGLKSFYDYKCQVCGNDFQPTYGVEIAESHHIHYLHEGGLDISRNILVLCPNHHRVVHETNALFVESDLAYLYPNGLIEPLLIPTHLVEARLRGVWEDASDHMSHQAAEQSPPYFTK